MCNHKNTSNIESPSLIQFEKDIIVGECILDGASSSSLRQGSSTTSSLITMSLLTLFLLCFSATIIAIAEETFQDDLRVSVFTDYSHTIIFIIFVLKLVSHKVLLHTMETTSWLFPRMRHTICNRVTANIGTTLWGFFWIPIKTFMCCILRRQPRRSTASRNNWNCFGISHIPVAS